MDKIKFSGFFWRAEKKEKEKKNDAFNYHMYSRWDINMYIYIIVSYSSDNDLPPIDDPLVITDSELRLKGEQPTKANIE